MAGGGGDWKDMYYAAERGDVDCVRYHLASGVDVDYQHPEAMVSALVVACMNGHEPVVRLLLEHGADPNLPAELGPTTPLQAARQSGHAALESVLRQHGAQPQHATRPAWWQRWLPGL
ncbi:ankyrin repeat domain-containing protein [Hylemonella sp. W303a]|uniref:ankyrin repeat domain-containing protein n=1 Tax=Hylemonella sp. W303a TaxID=3389873 RepID=UPI00396B2213